MTNSCSLMYINRLIERLEDLDCMFGAGSDEPYYKETRQEYIDQIYAIDLSPEQGARAIELVTEHRHLFS